MSTFFPGYLLPVTFLVESEWLFEFLLNFSSLSRFFLYYAFSFPDLLMNFACNVCSPTFPLSEFLYFSLIFWASNEAWSSSNFISARFLNSSLDTIIWSKFEVIYLNTFSIFCKSLIDSPHAFIWFVSNTNLEKRSVTDSSYFICVISNCFCIVYNFTLFGFSSLPYKFFNLSYAPLGVSSPISSRTRWDSHIDKSRK